MGIPVVIAASGGLPVVVATTGGLPMTIATNGYGIPVTLATSGYGLPVTGITFGPAAPAAPVLTLTSPTSDLTPDFTLVGDLVLGDTVRFQYSTSSGFAGASELTNTIDAAEDTANSINFTTGSLAVTTWYFRARIERPVYGNSNWSNTVTVTLSAVSYDAATTAWINAVVAGGGTVSDTQKGRVDALIVGLKADGLFSANSRLWLHAGESVAKQATIDLMALGVATLTVAPTLSATGYTGNGSTQYINYGATPSNYVQDNASFGAFCVNTRTAANTNILIGGQGGGISDLLPYYNATGSLMRVNSQGAGFVNGAHANSRGLFIGVRNAPGNMQVYLNGTSLGTETVASSAGAPAGFYGLARNDSGTPAELSGDTIACAWIGPALSGAQVTSLTTRLTTYLGAWGV